MSDVMEGYAVKTLVSFVERRGYFTHGEARALAILKAGRVEAEEAAGKLLIWIRQEIDPVAAAETYAASLATIRAAERFRQPNPFIFDNEGYATGTQWTDHLGRWRMGRGW